LPDLFDTVVVPDLVIKEIYAGTDSISKKINTVKWLSIKKIVLNENIIEWNLGKGETAVISYALKNADFKVVIDDKAARKLQKTVYNYSQKER
jgi:predicted nucleic acid-binding protein